MPPLQPAANDPAFNPALYVERNLAIDDTDGFVAWATVHSSKRLRSVLGSPGCGKTTFLQRLHIALDGNGHCVVFHLPPLPKDPGYDYEVALLQQLRDIGVTIPVLLVDDWEAFTAGQRQWIEVRILVPFLFSASTNSRIVIARRDEYALEEALLRWEEEVYWLEGLDKPNAHGPREQIRRRLDAVAGATPDEARETLEWPDAPNAAIDHARTLDDNGRATLVDQMSNWLTPNPHVNLTLLQRELGHPATPPTAGDCEACLRVYLTRAGLTPDYYDRLLQLSPHLDPDGRFTTQEYDARGSRAAELKALMTASVVAHASGTRRYRLEPAVLMLIRCIVPAAAPAPAAQANP